MENFTMELEITKTSKGKPLALLNGFQYRVKRKNDRVVTWLCTKEKTEKCRGTLVSEENSVLRVTEHVCKPDVAAAEVKKCIENAKKRAREDVDFLSMSKIYNEEVNGLFNRGFEVVAEIPAFSSVKTVLNRIRYNARGVIQNPATATVDYYNKARKKQQQQHQQEEVESKQGLAINEGASTSEHQPTTDPLHLDIKVEDTEVDIKDGITNFNESIGIKSEDDSRVFDSTDYSYNFNENDFSTTDINSRSVSPTSTSSQGTDLKSIITVIPQARESNMLESVSSDAHVTHPQEKRKNVRSAESASTSHKKKVHVPTNDFCVLCAKDISKLRKEFSVAKYSDIILVLTGVNVLGYEIPPNSCYSCYKAVTNIKEFQKQVHDATDLLKRKLAAYAEKHVSHDITKKLHLTASHTFDQEYCKTPDVNTQEMHVQDSTIINDATLHASAAVAVENSLNPPPLIFKAVFPFTKCDICGKLYKDLVNHNCQGKDVAAQSAIVDVPPVAEEKTYNSRLRKMDSDDILELRKLKALCSICGKTYYKTSYKTHMRSHLGSTAQCKICGNKVRISSLRFHMLNHQKTDEKVICSVCGKMYSKLAGLKKHEVVHGEKRHKCAICGQCFHYSKYLQRHLRSHSGEKPFACPYCDKTFSILWNLHQHKRLHTNEKPYKCQLCSSSFRHNVTLKHHLSSSHTADEIAGSGKNSSASPKASRKSASGTSRKAENCDKSDSVVSHMECQKNNICDENVK